VKICEGLGEVRYGQWTGRSLKQLARTRLWRVVQQQPSAMQFPKGETLRAVQARAVGAIEEIAHAHSKDKGMVAAVSHGDVIKLIVAYYLGMPLDLFQRIVISTASVTVLRLGHGHPTLVKLNETFPLDQR
jgi:probable phosphoglycerate mutase